MMYRPQSLSLPRSFPGRGRGGDITCRFGGLLVSHAARRYLRSSVGKRRNRGQMFTSSRYGQREREGGEDRDLVHYESPLIGYIYKRGGG